MHFSFETVEQLVDAIRQLERRPDDQAMIFLAKRHEPEVDALIAGLNEARVEFFGGVFPGLIHGAQRLDHGAVVNFVPTLAAPRIVSLGQDGVEWPQEPLPGAEGSETKPTVFIMVDFWSRSVTALLDELFDRYGNSVSYLGMGAGMAERRTSLCIFTPAGRFESSAVLAFLDLETQSHLRHGWERIHGPLVATRTERNVIHELNWEPAGTVYRALVEADAVNVPPLAEFIQTAKRYPFGIYREGQEDVVRDPLAIEDDGSLMCLSDIPQNSVLHLLRGQADKLVAGCQQAVAECQQAPVTSLRSCLVLDCYSRAVLLEDAFQTELDTLAEGIAKVYPRCSAEGVLALGEIASDGERLPEFHNKTCVLGLLHG